MILQLAGVVASLFITFSTTDAAMCFQCSSYFSMYCEDLWSMDTPIRPSNCTLDSSLEIIDNIVMWLQEPEDLHLSSEEDLENYERYRRSLMEALNATLLQTLGAATEATLNRSKRADDDYNWDCFKINVKGLRNRVETFRGCIADYSAKMNTYSFDAFCSLIGKHNAKGDKSLLYCNYCTPKGNPDTVGEVSSIPCNQATPLGGLRNAGFTWAATVSALVFYAV